MPEQALKLKANTAKAVVPAARMVRGCFVILNSYSELNVAWHKQAPEWTSPASFFSIEVGMTAVCWPEHTRWLSDFDASGQHGAPAF
jgi:hypothetical protein